MTVEAEKNWKETHLCVKRKALTCNYKKHMRLVSSAVEKKVKVEWI